MTFEDCEQLVIFDVSQNAIEGVVTEKFQIRHELTQSKIGRESPNLGDKRKQRLLTFGDHGMFLSLQVACGGGIPGPRGSGTFYFADCAK